jgi:hypothetical protein
MGLMKVNKHDPLVKVKANFWDEKCDSYREFEYTITFSDWTAEPQITYDIRDYLTLHYGNSVTNSINYCWDIQYIPEDNNLVFYILNEEILTGVLLIC